MKEESNGLTSLPIKEGAGISSIPSGAPEILLAKTGRFSLKRLADGQVTVRDEEVGETFHPVIGAMNEARQLYVAQTFLHTCWDDEQTVHKTVWDVGLGAAANSVAVYESWCKGSYGNLTMESFDKNRNALVFALQHMKENAASLSYLEGWDWEHFLKMNILTVSRGSRTFTWRFHEGDFRETYPRAGTVLPDLIMYDLFSAPKCPALYSLQHWQKLRTFLDGHDCSVILHTRSTVVRVTLALAGWYLGTGIRLGDKEETTVAATRKELLREALEREWLGKVGRSTSASPILGETMGSGPVPSDCLEKLRHHPQWAD